MQKFTKVTFVSLMLASITASAAAAYKYERLYEDPSATQNSVSQVASVSQVGPVSQVSSASQVGPVSQVSSTSQIAAFQSPTDFNVITATAEPTEPADFIETAFEPTNFTTDTGSSSAPENLNLSATAAQLEAAAPNLNPKVLKLALETYNKARAKGYDKRGILSVIDFSQPSYEKSLWIFNVNTGKLLLNTYVAHGKNSGDVTATQFSNQHGSDESSLGMYLTGNTYYGHDGLAMRLIGLSGKYNDEALSRDVVMHGAWYVSQSFLDANHRLGRSWGCPAVGKNLIGPITNILKNGTLIYAYGTDSSWSPTYVA